MILMIVFHLKRGKTEGELTSFHCKDSIERRAGGRSWSLNNVQKERMAIEEAYWQVMANMV